MTNLEVKIQTFASWVRTPWILPIRYLYSGRIVCPCFQIRRI